MESKAVPPRPSSWLERLAMGLFVALSPRLPRVEQPGPPERLEPFEIVAVPRPGGPSLGGTWFPTHAPPRGAVLLLHPWLVWGRAYFHLRGRIEALRAAGYHALALDFSGFGASGPRRQGFFDRDVEAGLDFLRQQAGGLPLHVWGVSAGGYWAHPALSRTDAVAGAVFEDVSPHLLEWSWRMAPWGRPFYLFFRNVFGSAYRFLDIRRHASGMSLGAVAYVSGELDCGVRPEDTRELSRRARGRCHIVPGADHLGAIKLAGDEVIALALETFRRAEEAKATGCLQEL